MKTFKFSLVLRTCENTNVFITLDDNIYGIHIKWVNILYLFSRTRVKEYEHKKYVLSVSFNSYKMLQDFQIYSLQATSTFSIHVIIKEGNQTLTQTVRVMPCKNMFLGTCRQQRPRSACASMKPDQGLHCQLLNRIIGYYRMYECEWRAKPGWCFAHGQDDLNLCILSMF